MPKAKSISLRAPAKINLVLFVLGPGPGGYHRIASFMHRIDLADRITLTPRPVKAGIRLVSALRGLPRGDTNLAVRAAELFFRRFGIKSGLRIDLEKHIPLGAGLGGGSSDAASTLRGLCRLFRVRPPKDELTELAASLGSDVPFFLDGPSAWVGGVGEEVFSVPSSGRAWAVLVNPGAEVSTRWAYAEFDRDPAPRTADPSDSLKKMGLTLDGDRIKLSGRAIRAFPLVRRSFTLQNDLEAITIRRYPVVARLKGELCALGAREALMSGSGSTVFGLFEDRAAALRAGAVLRKRDRAGSGRTSRPKKPKAWRVWVVRLVGRGGR